MYINMNSNHPPSIIKQIPSSINRRSSNLSSDEEVFLSNIQPYREASKKSGFRDELTYVELRISEERNNDKRKRKGKIIWFNPPYSKNAKTNIIHKHFHKHYISIFRHHIHFKKFLIKSQLR